MQSLTSSAPIPSSWRVLFGTFLVANCIAAFYNHIDDTDETYGYWEVLHYLNFGRGMQTWEYSPQFAIRSYTFICGILPFAELYKMVGLSKIEIFYGIRLILGSFTAYSQARFLHSIESSFGTAYVRLSAMLMLFSPGILFAGTSFLPSAIAMNTVMLGMSNWLADDYLSTIMWGCVAVLCTGWPFVGVIFLPLGLTMLYRSYTAQTSTTLLQLIIGGICILAVIGGVSTFIDMHFYGKLTSPTWNILSYNAAGNGDNLYGTEPASYYYRNLFLNVGIILPLSIATPLLLLRNWLDIRHVKFGRKIREKTINMAVICSCASLWLLLLFSRPHKEERFMYPVYPLLVVLAVFSALSMCNIISRVVSSVIGEKELPDDMEEQFQKLHIIGTLPESQQAEKLKKFVNHAKSWSSIIRFIIMTSILFASVTLCFGRVASNVNNYGGYMQLWSDVSTNISKNNPDKKVMMCLGGEWYKFNSHYFLPENVRISFVKDNFGGQLPQYFAEREDMGFMQGTSSDPLHPMNDLNKEEVSRYIPLAYCDYVVASMDPHSDRERSPMVRQMTILNSKESRHKLIDEKLDLVYFEPVIRHDVIDPARSESSLARAYAIPIYSSAKNKYNEYILFKRNKDN